MFDFLNISVQPNAEKSVVKTAKGGGKAAQERNPTNGAHLRLFKDGRLYPSAELVAKFNLEYTDIATKGGNGFDVTESSRWTNTASNPNTCIFISAIPKAEPKVDLFGSTTYFGPKDELPEGKKVGDAASSAITQGPATFGKKLIVMLREAYNLDSTIVEGTEGGIDPLFGEKNHVDLFIAEKYPVTLPDGIYYLPKQVSSGENKGEWTVVRRENITMFPLVVFTPECVTTEVVSESVNETVTEAVIEEANVQIV